MRHLKPKDMKLYSEASSIFRDLEAIGYKDGDVLALQDLNNFDQLHYHGAKSVKEAIKLLKISRNKRVLEIGAGWGGPSRVIAAEASSQVVALELQKDFHEVGSTLTEMCGLSSKVSHILGDFLEADFKTSEFDFVVSWLALYHIPKRVKFSLKIHEILSKNGMVYVEDLIKGNHFKKCPSEIVEQELFANSLVGEDEYLEILQSSGFEIVSAKNMGTNWLQFTSERLETFMAAEDKFTAIHGRNLFKARAHFYRKIVDFFSHDFVSGLSIVARKLSQD